MSVSRMLFAAWWAAVVAASGCVPEAGTCVAQVQVRVPDPSPLAESGDVAHLSVARGGRAVLEQDSDLVGAGQAGGTVTLLDAGTGLLPAGQGYALTLTVYSSIDRNTAVAQGGATFDCLADGTVDVPLYLGPANAFGALPAVPGARAGATATTLADGRVLLFGGVSSVDAPSAALFDARTSAWCASDDCFPSGTPPSRTGHTATRLDDGAIIIIGGTDSSGAAVPEVLRFDADGSFTPIASLPVRAHAAARASADQVLVAGGLDQDGLPVATLTFVSGGGALRNSSAALAVARAYPALAPLAAGSMLVAGGEDELGPLDSVEVVDTVAEAVDIAKLPCSTPGAGDSMLCARRSRARAIVLDDGNVLIAGGVAESLDGDPPPEADVFLVSDERAMPAADMPRTFDRTGAALARVPCGAPPCPVLLVGGAQSPHALFTIAPEPPLLGDEVYGGSLLVAERSTALGARAGIAAAPVSPGGVLVVGGDAGDGQPHDDSAWFSFCEPAAEDIPCPAP